MSAQDQMMNADEMYLEEVFTDQQMGQVRRLTPVDSNGDADASRPVLFQGSTQMMTPAGALPLNFDIPAQNLGEAIAQFAGCAQQSMEETIKELQELRREQASSIVVPGQTPSGIQMP